MKPKVETVPYMIQRLCEPSTKGGINPFSFGGGFRNGGLSDDAARILSRLFDFDYMGRAEFENGIVGDSFSKIADLAVAGQMVSGEQKIPEGNMLYYYCPVAIEEEVRKIIKNLACECPNFRLKEPALVYEALHSQKEHYKRIIGWLDVRNHYLFFKTQETWSNLCAIFTELQKLRATRDECGKFVG